MIKLLRLSVCLSAMSGALAVSLPPSPALSQSSRCVAYDAAIDSVEVMPAFINSDPLIRPGTVVLESGLQLRIKGWNDASIVGLSMTGYAVQTSCGQTVSWAFGQPIDGSRGVSIRDLRVSSTKTDAFVSLPKAARFAATPGALSSDFAGLIVAAVPIGPSKFDLIAIQSSSDKTRLFASVAMPTKIATINADLAAISQAPSLHGGRLIQFVTKPVNGNQIGLFRVIFTPVEPSDSVH